MIVKLFEPCTITYKDALLDKPVKYTQEFLKEVAENTNYHLLNNDHDYKGIGYFKDFAFNDDGDFVADLTTDESLKGRGFSPEFGCDLADGGDVYIATNGYLRDIAISDNPRNRILYNSLPKGDKMAEDNTNEVLSNQIKELQKEIAQKDLKIESQAKRLANVDSMETRLGELEKSNQELEATIKMYEPQAKAYSELEAKRKEQLLEKIAGDSADIKAKYEGFTMEQLETVLETKTVNTEPKGVDTKGAQGLGDPEPPKDPNAFNKDRFSELYQNAYGEAPSFLNND